MLLWETSWWLVGFGSFLNDWRLLTELIEVKWLWLLRWRGVWIGTVTFILVLKNFFSGRSHFVPTTCCPRRLPSYGSFRLGHSSTSLSRQGRSSPFESSRLLLACCICLPRLERILGIRIAGGSSSVTSFVDKLTFCLFLGVHLRKADVIDSELKMFPMLHDCQRMAHQAECEIEWALELLAVTNEHTVTVDASFARQLWGEHLYYAQMSVQLDAPTELHFRSKNEKD